MFECSFYATLPLFETDRPHHRAVTPIYYMDTVFGIGFVPGQYVDVGPVMDAKVAMLSAHDSQLAWLREHDGIDVVEQMTVASRYAACSAEPSTRKASSNVRHGCGRPPSGFFPRQGGHLETEVRFRYTAASEASRP